MEKLPNWREFTHFLVHFYRPKIMVVYQNLKICGVEKNVPSLGTGDANKMGEFSEKVSKGGGEGSFSIQKYVAEFEPLNRAISDVFRKKLHHAFLKMRGGRGVKRHWELFRKFIRFGSLAPSLTPSRTYGRTLR